MPGLVTAFHAAAPSADEALRSAQRALGIALDGAAASKTAGLPADGFEGKAFGPAEAQQFIDFLNKAQVWWNVSLLCATLPKNSLSSR